MVLASVLPVILSLMLPVWLASKFSTLALTVSVVALVILLVSIGAPALPVKMVNTIVSIPSTVLLRGLASSLTVSCNATVLVASVLVRTKSIL